MNLIILINIMTKSYNSESFPLSKETTLSLNSKNINFISFQNYVHSLFVCFLLLNASKLKQGNEQIVAFGRVKVFSMTNVS